MAGKDENMQLYEKVTGRIPLANKRSIEEKLKEACNEFKAEYTEAADCLIVTGTLVQLVEIEKYIAKYNNTKERESSVLNSSEHSEKVASLRSLFDTQPYLACFIQKFHHEYLKSFQQSHNVVMTWVADGTKIEISGFNSEDLKLACDKFTAFYQHLHQYVLKFTLDVTTDGKGYTKETLEQVVCAVPQYVTGLVLEKEPNGRLYNLWGTNTALANGQEWIRNQLGIQSPGTKARSLSPQAIQNALVHETPNKIKVVVYEGDITKENADIIVNACNKHLDHGGGVSFAIVKAGGSSIQRESDEYVKQHGVLSTGDVVMTSSGILKCKKILHAVGPQWKRNGRDKSIKLLNKIFGDIYRIAASMKATSVAMPAISTGIYGVPKEVCAETTFSSINNLDQTIAANKAGPLEIRLVNIDPETVKVFRQEFHKWSLKGKKVERRHSFKYSKKDPEKLPDFNRSADDMHTQPKIKTSLIPVQNSKYKNGALNTTTSIAPQPFPNSSTGQRYNLSTMSITQGHTWETTQPYSQPEQLSNTPASSKSGRNTSAHQNGLDSLTTPQGKTLNNDCSICHCTMTDPKVLPKCGHTFCAPCIDTAFTYKMNCPICQEVYGITEGDQPDGTMTVQRSHHGSLSGYAGSGIYTITYTIPSGKQNSRHPNPGKKFYGAARRAFLPASKEGEEVLKLLQKAFEKKLIFTVGRSTSTGKDNCVTWNDIHHKTNMTGGPQSFGYPDPDYLGRVKDELKAKGIVPE